jgi:hypothetical protein
MTAGLRSAEQPRAMDVAIRCAIIGAALATSLIHASLGGALFTMNAAGYAVLAVAMAAPGPFAAERWLVRLALLGFTAATIGGWLLFGARFELAYIDKVIEIVLIVLLIVELWRQDGGPSGIARRARHLARRPVASGSARA